MSVTVTLQTKVKDGRFKELLPFLEANLPNVRGFAGARSVAIHYNPETEDFLIFEEWASREHHERYLTAITETGVLADLADFLTEPPRIHYYGKLSI